jgi:hypothetical protein
MILADNPAFILPKYQQMFAPFCNINRALTSPLYRMARNQKKHTGAGLCRDSDQ